MLATSVFQQGCFLYLTFPVGFQLLITFIFCQFCFICVTFVVFVSIASYFHVLTGSLCIPNISCWCSVANYICVWPVLLVCSLECIVCVAFCLWITVASCFCVLTITRVMVFCVVKMCLCTFKGDGISCCENVPVYSQGWWYFVLWKCACVLSRVMVFHVVKMCLCTLKGDGILCCENATFQSFCIACVCMTFPWMTLCCMMLCWIHSSS